MDLDVGAQGEWGGRRDQADSTAADIPDHVPLVVELVTGVVDDQQPVIYGVAGFLPRKGDSGGEDGSLG
jgi:hypothetical protein